MMGLTQLCLDNAHCSMLNLRTPIQFKLIKSPSAQVDNKSNGHDTVENVIKDCNLIG